MLGKFCCGFKVRVGIGWPAVWLLAKLGRGLWRSGSLVGFLGYKQTCSIYGIENIACSLFMLLSLSTP